MAGEERGVVAVEPTYKFVDKEWDEDIVCSVCSFPLEAPTTHKTCNESFCLECVQESFECPSCNKDPGEDSFSPVTQRFVLRILGKVKVKCELCSIVCPISEFETHKKECPKMVVECGGKHLGCGYSSQRTDLPSHEKDCPLFKLSPLLTNLTNRIESLETKSETLELANNALRETSSKQTNQIAALELAKGALETKTKKLQAENEMLRKNSAKDFNQIQELKKTPFAGISYVEFPLPRTSKEEKSVRLFSGFYKVRIDFGIADGGEDISVYFYFEEGPFDDMFPKFPFEGKVIVSLLSPAHQPIKTGTLDSECSEGFKECASKFPSSYGRGWHKLEKLEVVKRKLDGNKLWFSVKIERKA